MNNKNTLNPIQIGGVTYTCVSKPLPPTFQIEQKVQIQQKHQHPLYLGPEEMKELIRQLNYLSRQQQIRQQVKEIKRQQQLQQQLKEQKENEKQIKDCDLNFINNNYNI